MHLQSLQILGIAFVGIASARTENIEIHTAYAAPIEGHTRYLTKEGSTTRLVTGVDPNYLSSTTRTTDPNNPQSTVVAGVQLAVDQKDGKTVITLADAKKQEVDGVIKAAVEACQRPKLNKRVLDVNCYMVELNKAAKNADFLKLEDESQIESFDIDVHGEAPEVIKSASSDLSGPKEKNKFAIVVAMSLVAGVDLLASTLPAELGSTPWRVEFPDDEVGGPPEEDVEEGDEGDEEEEDEDEDDTPPEDETKTATSTSPSTTTGCGPKATIHEDSPACDDDDCGGKDGKCAKDGTIKGCPCAYWATAHVDTNWDPDWRDFQQGYLADLIENGPDVLPPTCFRNTNGDNFEGKPKAEPSAWCVCSSIGDNTFTSGMYATMTGKGNDACTYTTMPTSQVTVSLKTNTATEITSCRLEDKYNFGQKSCTCNDDKGHGPTFTTLNGKKTSVCPDFARQTDNNDDEGPSEKDWVKIVALEFRTNNKLDKLFWDVHLPGKDSNVVCSESEGLFMGNSTDNKEPPSGRYWPSGKIEFTWPVGDFDECVYENDGYQDGDDLSKAGTFKCGDRPFSCKDRRAKIDEKNRGFKRCDLLSENVQTDVFESEVIVCESI